jgi:tripartite-type tricarboxylate transporter receptor subunit TctC
MLRRHVFLSIASVLAASHGTVLGAGPADATPEQGVWPSRPLRLLVGFPPGSSPDLTARLLAQPLAQALGQPVVVENKPGTSGNIAADQLAKSSDGHTLGLLINGNLTTAKLLNPHTPYEPATDLTPISLLAMSPLVLMAANSVSFHDIPSFLSAARKAGDQWSYGSPGMGTVSHLGMELLAEQTGIQAVHVPYPGNPQVIQGLITGELQLALLPPGLALAQQQAGRIKVVGLAASGRSVLAPGVPSLEEGGLKNYRAEVWNALVGPAHMPAARVERLSRLINEILRRPELRRQLQAQGWQVIGGSPEALRERMRSERAQMAELIRARGIRMD